MHGCDNGEVTIRRALGPRRVRSPVWFGVLYKALTHSTKLPYEHTQYIQNTHTLHKVPTSYTKSGYTQIIVCAHDPPFCAHGPLFSACVFCAFVPSVLLLVVLVPCPGGPCASVHCFCASCCAMFVGFCAMFLGCCAMCLASCAMVCLAVVLPPVNVMLLFCFLCPV